MRSCFIREHPAFRLYLARATTHLCPSLFLYFPSFYTGGSAYTRPVAVLNVLSLLMFLVLPSRSIPNIFAPHCLFFMSDIELYPPNIYRIKFCTLQYSDARIRQLFPPPFPPSPTPPAILSTFLCSQQFINNCLITILQSTLVVSLS